MKLLVIAFVVAGTGLAAGFIAQNLWEDDPSIETATAALGATVLDCPSGIVLTSYAGGSRVFAVGRTESEDWIQVRDLSSPDRTVWLSASEVDLDDDIGGLPVAECPDMVGDVAALGTTTTTIAGTTTTTITESTTTSVDTTTTTSRSTTTTDRATTSSSTSTTVTTNPPDTTAPQIAQPALNPTEIWELDFPNLACPANTPRVSTITAVVTDNVSVASVTASWTINGNQTTVAMSRSGNTYSSSIGPYPYGTVPDSASVGVVITIRALDASGNQSTASRTLTLTSSGECLE